MPSALSPGRPEPVSRDVAGALAGLVAAIGGAGFAQAFLAAMRALAGVELCSVFRHAGSAGVHLLFAVGEGALPPDVALRASRAYARAYWRSDAQLIRLARTAGNAPVIVRRRASEIADPAYRVTCYERAGVAERLSIVWPGRPGFVASGYRTAGSAAFTPQDIDRLELYAGLLIAALEQHLRAGAGQMPDEPALVEALLGLECGLSVREAEVAGALILGETQERIAQGKRVSLATIVTYRRRAYAKLGVGRRRELVALHRRLAAGAPFERPTD